MDTPDAEVESPVIRLLLVDDEPSVLKSLKRLFFDLDIDIRTAESGDQALALLKEEAADIIISDMRMPGMDGAELFTEIANILPSSERILLTGYADLESTIGAINNGRVNYYVEKPWDDDRLRRIVNKGIEIIESKFQMKQLKQQVYEQNEQLQSWNSRLEEQVQERTKELESSNEQLHGSLKKIRLSHQNTVELFSNLIERRMGDQQINRRIVAWVLDTMGSALSIDDKTRKSLVYAGILCNIGKLSFSDHLLQTPYLDLDVDQQRRYQQHIGIAVNLMSSIPPLAKAAGIMALRQEYEDGSGYPRGIKADGIDDCAAILVLVGDYFQYCQGSIDGCRHASDEALAIVVKLSGTKYRRSVVEAFQGIWPKLREKFQLGEEKVPLSQMQPGMVLTRNLYSHDAKLLLAEGIIIDTGIIQQLKKFQELDPNPWFVYVQD